MRAMRIFLRPIAPPRSWRGARRGDAGSIFRHCGNGGVFGHASAAREPAAPAVRGRYTLQAPATPAAAGRLCGAGRRACSHLVRPFCTTPVSRHVPRRPRQDGVRASRVTARHTVTRLRETARAASASRRRRATRSTRQTVRCKCPSAVAPAAAARARACPRFLSSPRHTRAAAARAFTGPGAGETGVLTDQLLPTSVLACHFLRGKAAHVRRALCRAMHTTSARVSNAGACHHTAHTHAPITPAAPPPRRAPPWPRRPRRLRRGRRR
jgi:hypothetical protein